MDKAHKVTMCTLQHGDLYRGPFTHCTEAEVMAYVREALHMGMAALVEALEEKDSATR